MVGSVRIYNKANYEDIHLWIEMYSRVECITGTMESRIERNRVNIE